MEREELKKNYILLSKVAKEKKYAQEYLGLLARRGDIGSIRIGKRWYTTWDWFFEFEKDAKEKKEEMRAAEKIVEAAKVMIAINPAPQKSAGVRLPEERVGLQHAVKEEKVLVATPAVKLEEKKKEKILRENIVIAPKTDSEKISIKVSSLQIARRLPTVNLKEKIGVRLAEKRPLEIRRRMIQPALAKNNFQVAKKETKPARLNISNDVRGFSPSFSPVREIGLSLFQKFAFSAAVVLSLVLFVQVGFIYKGEVKKLAGFGSGVVAGAQDSKADLSTAKNFSLGYLEDRGDKIKEDISLSRVLIRAAVEREK